jgi:hypothetical protein
MLMDVTKLATKVEEVLPSKISPQAETKPADKRGMTIFKFNILPLEEIERREAFKEAVNNCPYCHSPLNFQLEQDQDGQTVHERAQCVQCTQHFRLETHHIQ